MGGAPTGGPAIEGGDIGVLAIGGAVMGMLAEGD